MSDVRYDPHEIIEDAIDHTRRTMRQARGGEPAQLVHVEQVQTLGGLRAMLVLDTPEGRRGFLLSADDAAAAAVRLHDVAAGARRSLFLPGSVPERSST